ncbi:MAG: LysM peptidoglycan-binding domain-containing protein, partial [Chitinophagales bacterium]
MKKPAIICLTGLLAITSAKAQPHLLLVQGESGKLYIEHTIDTKENWYSVGRLYNISPKQIAPFNKSKLDKPLEIGQRLKIPLTADNFYQTSDKPPAGFALVPVYHTIQAKEWMYHISVTYNKVPIAKLEKWNHITGDQAKAGMQLIVGYLKVKPGQSALASPPKEKTASSTASLAPVKEEGKPASNSTSSIGKDEKKSETVSKKSPAAVPAQEQKSELYRPLPDSHPVATTENNFSSNSYLAGHSVGGYFSSEYSDDNKSLSGLAGTFKSTSGWQDGKYYALMNNIPVGTIVKVTSTSSNKTIYAKVLGQLP